MSAAGLWMAADNTTTPRKPKPKPKPKPKSQARGTKKALSKPPKAANSSAPRLAGAKGSAKARFPKSPPKASGKAVAKAKAPRRPASAIKSKAMAEQPLRIWTACFVFAGAGDTAGMAIRRIRARHGQKAREIALKSPPGEEFMLTMVPESDEQFLGQVRLKALCRR